MQKILVMFVDGTQEVRQQEEFTLEDMQKIVGGSIQLCKDVENRDMYVNESGMIDNLPINARATEVLHDDYKLGFAFPVSVHGDAFIRLKNKPE